MLLFVLILVSFYLLICLLLYLFQSKLIFFPQSISEFTLEQARKKHPNTEITFKTSDGETLHGWFLPSGNPSIDPLVIYFGGNGEEVSINVIEDGGLPKATALFVNYRGYGLSTGNPSSAALQSDALLIYDEMIQKGFRANQIIVAGRSLGTGIAVHLAHKRNVNRVLLVSPYDSIRAVAQKRYPLIPVGLLLKQNFDSLNKTQQLNLPLKMILAENDSTIPHWHSDRVFASWCGPKEQVTIAQALHNNLQDFDSYWNEIMKFVQPSI